MADACQGWQMKAERIADVYALSPSQEGVLLRSLSARESGVCPEPMPAGAVRAGEASTNAGPVLIAAGEVAGQALARAGLRGERLLSFAQERL